MKLEKKWWWIVVTSLRAEWFNWMARYDEVTHTNAISKSGARDRNKYWNHVWNCCHFINMIIHVIAERIFRCVCRPGLLMFFSPSSLYLSESLHCRPILHVKSNMNKGVIRCTHAARTPTRPSYYSFDCSYYLCG